MLAANNFTYDWLTPVLGYLMSCMGAFIGLRCTTRAYAHSGAARARWLALAAISIGTTGVWVMQFIALLGYTIPGMTIRYNVPITIGSMLIAVAVVFAGLLIVGFGHPTVRNLLIAGVITGVGVASMHYTGMAAMEMPATMTYQPTLSALSVLIGIVAATAALWAALRLRGAGATLGAALIMGVAVSGMHYTGMAAMRMHAAAPGPAGSLGGATAEGFLLPLIIGIGVIAIVMTALLVFSPTDDEIREDRELMDRINAATARLAAVPEQPPAPPAAPAPAGPAGGWPGPSAPNGWTGSNGQAGQYDQARQYYPPRQYDQSGQYGQAGQAEPYGAEQNGYVTPNGQAAQNGNANRDSTGGRSERNGRNRPRRRTGGSPSPADRDLR